MTCTRCDGTGWLNVHQLPDAVDGYDTTAVEAWIAAQTEPHDVQVCDCCGNCETWRHEPGKHGPDEVTFDCM